MTANEIMQIINKKGSVTKEVFNAYLSAIKEGADDGRYWWCTEFDDDTFATFIYNLTVLIMPNILEHPVFFEKEYGINEKKRTRMQKDIQNMTHIDYPKNCPYSDSDMNYFEQYIIGFAGKCTED